MGWERGENGNGVLWIMMTNKMWCCKSFHCQKDSIWLTARTAQFTKVSFIVFVEKSLNGRSRGPCSNPACYASERSISMPRSPARSNTHEAERERENKVTLYTQVKRPWDETESIVNTNLRLYIFCCCWMNSRIISWHLGQSLIIPVQTWTVLEI